MREKEQVCSFELAKKLKYLNLRQDSLFFWLSDKKLYYRLDRSMLSVSMQTLMKKSAFLDSEEWFSAYTVAELYQLLSEECLEVDVPSKIKSHKLADYLAEKLYLIILRSNINPSIDNK